MASRRIAQTRSTVRFRRSIAVLSFGSGRSAAYRAPYRRLNSSQARLGLARQARNFGAFSPWRRALNATRLLPSGVRGPVDFCALARLAASKAGGRGICAVTYGYTSATRHPLELPGQVPNRH
jgi:hypothetical protein